jgi:hypothetical protein
MPLHLIWLIEKARFSLNLSISATKHCMIINSSVLMMITSSNFLLNILWILFGRSDDYNYIAYRRKKRVNLFYWMSSRNDYVLMIDEWSVTVLAIMTIWRNGSFYTYSIDAFLIRWLTMMTRTKWCW